MPAVMLLCCLLLRLPFPLLRLLTYRRLLLFFPLFFLLQFHTVVVVDVTVSVSASTAADGSVVSAAASVAVCYSASSAVIATVVSSSAVGGSVQSSLSALAASVQSLEPSGKPECKRSISHFDRLKIELWLMISDWSSYLLYNHQINWILSITVWSAGKSLCQSNQLSGLLSANNNLSTWKV